jgi:hypothetical protein
VADGIDAAVEAVEAAGPHARGRSALAQSELPELIESDNAVLPSGKAPDRSVERGFGTLVAISATNCRNPPAAALRPTPHCCC